MQRLIIIAISLLFIIGCSSSTPNIKNSSSKSKTITLLGTYTWDVESGTLGGSDSNVDFWWERVDAKTGHLIPRNGTTVEITKKSFASLDKAYMKTFPIFRDGRVSSSDIKVGTVVMFKTAEGNYGKLRIKGFRSIHDFSFKEAREHINDSWKKMVLKKPNNRKYHLVVEYVLL